MKSCAVRASLSAAALAIVPAGPAARSSVTGCSTRGLVVWLDTQGNGAASSVTAAGLRVYRPDQRLANVVRASGYPRRWYGTAVSMIRGESKSTLRLM